MPFELTNTPVAFIDLMNRVFWDYLDQFVIFFSLMIFLCTARMIKSMSTPQFSPAMVERAKVVCKVRQM